MTLSETEKRVGTVKGPGGILYAIWIVQRYGMYEVDFVEAKCGHNCTAMIDYYIAEATIEDAEREVRELCGSALRP